MKVGVSGQKDTQTTVNGLDPLEQQWREQLMKASQGASTNGPGPGLTGANDYYTQLMKGGATGTAALSGDPSAVAGMMNPYQQQVIDAMNKQFGVQNQQVVNNSNSDATSAGAFGGNRAAVQAGTALSANQLGQNTQIGGLLQSGFSDAMSRAAALAQGGYAGAGGAANLGMQGVGNPDLWKMMMLRGGLMGVPYGTTQGSTGSRVGTQAGFNLFGG